MGTNVKFVDMPRVATPRSARYIFATLKFDINPHKRIYIDVKMLYRNFTNALLSVKGRGADH